MTSSIDPTHPSPATGSRLPASTSHHESERIPVAGGRKPVAGGGLLRFLTCGSVDDGKSTLIGRLLFDSKAILSDALQALERTSLRRGHRGMDLSLLTDGLQAEREQGITIDVAYRYFSTGARKYILADAPGHEQYTRNMVTAASTADLAIVLVDARKGLLTQTRRHSAIAHLLGIRHLVVAVNKMDLVDWSEARYEEIRTAYLAFARELGIQDPRFIPLSALRGDMVVDRGEHLPWYEGPTLMEALEAAELEGAASELPFRFPVQLVSRPHQDHRAYLGRVESGTVRVGDAVTALPSGRSSRVKAIHLGASPLDAAVAGQSVALRLEDELDIARGDLLAAAEGAPPPTRELAASLSWFSEAPLAPGRRYLLRHGTRELRAVVERIDHRLDIHTLEARAASSLELNDLGRVRLRLQQPLAADPYALDRSTGAFILVDEATHATVAAGLIQP